MKVSKSIRFTGNFIQFIILIIPLIVISIYCLSVSSTDYLNVKYELVEGQYVMTDFLNGEIDGNNRYIIDEVNIPKEISKIDIQDRLKLNIEKLTISNNVKEISKFYNIFEDNVIESLYYEGTIEEWAKINFDSIYSNPTYFCNSFYVKNNNEYVEVTNSYINNISEFNNYCFAGYKGISEIHLSENVTKIGVGIFAGCEGINTLSIVENDLYSSENNVIIDKSNNSLIAGCKTSIIPSNIEAISDYAMYKANLGSSFTLPDNITKIGNYAFGYNFETIELHKNVRSIGSYAFGESVNSLIFNGNLVDWCNIEFSDNGNPISENTIIRMNLNDNGLETISDSIVIPDSITEIGNEQFKYFNFYSVIFHENITKIGNKAFYDVPISNFTLPSKLEVIGDYAFWVDCNYNWYEMNLNISSTITSIGKSAFVGRHILTINVDDNNTNYSDYDNNILVDIKKKTLIASSEKAVIPSGIEIIAEGVFQTYIMDLLIIPEGVTTIGEGCFTAARISSLVLPESLVNLNCSLNETTYVFGVSYNCVDKIYHYGNPNDFGYDYDSKYKYSNVDFSRMYYYMRVQPEDSNYKYWRFVDGVPTVW